MLKNSENKGMEKIGLVTPTPGVFSLKKLEKTPHSSPITVNYEVSFVFS